MAYAPLRISFAVLLIFPAVSKIQASAIGVPTRVQTIEDELKRHPTFPKEDLEKLKDFIQSKPTLPEISKRRLFDFHFSKDCVMNKTEHAIETFYKLFQNRPEFSMDRSMQDPMVKKAIGIAAAYISPVRLENDRQIIFGTLLTSDLTDYNFYEVTKYGLMVADASAKLYGVANHTEGVLDCYNLTFTHISPILADFSLIREAIELVEVAAPLKPTAIHLINAPAVVDYLFRIVKPFLSQELIDKVKIYKTYEMDKFREAVSDEVLPKEMNGKLGTLQSLKENCEKSISLVEPIFAEEEAAVKKTQTLQVDSEEEEEED